MGSQTLGKDGQPIFLKDSKCPHGVRQDDRGNSGCEECREDDGTDHYLLGKAVGQEDLVGQLRQKAGEYFAANNDPLAKTYRDIAEWVKSAAAESRKRHAEYRAELEAKQKAVAKA